MPPRPVRCRNIISASQPKFCLPRGGLPMRSVISNARSQVSAKPAVQNAPEACRLSTDGDILIPAGSTLEQKLEVVEVQPENVSFPVLRVTGYDTPYPPATIEGHYLPSVERILDAIHRVRNY